jgi:hypothetical protein
VKARLVIVALLLAATAFQGQGPTTLRAADPLVSPATFRDFFPPEGGLRWSSDRSAIVFPDPGPLVPVRVEVHLSAWRPPGQAGPQVVISAGGRSVTMHPGPGAERVTLETTTSGFWRSDLEVEIRSDVFSPGEGDQRRLGVRVEDATLVPLARGVRIPPLGALVEVALLGGLIRFVLGRAGISATGAERTAFVAVTAVAALIAVARPVAAIWLGPFVLLVALLSVASALMPRTTHAVSPVASAFAHALREGFGRLRDAQIAALVIIGAVLVTLAYRVPSRIDIDLGSGREAAVAQGFGAFVGMGGEKARIAPRGARLDLSDFGGGASWKIEAAASLEGAARDVAVLQAAGRELILPLQDGKWTTGAMSAPSPFGWKSGLVLEVKGGSDALRLDRVSIERGGSLPSLRVLAAIVLAGLLAVIAFGAAGVSIRAGRLAGTCVVLGATLALAYEPLAAVPFSFRFLAIVVLAALGAAKLRAIRGFLDNGERLLPGPAAIAAAIGGWAAWLTAAAFPLYRGGHFVFHSSIAEEIWKGRFLIYYLPFPGSMLSEQAQWGNIVMPHPALYQTLVSPLSALPRPWFYLAEKIVLASLFSSLVLVASVVAERVSGKRAGVFTAILFAGLVPGFQLLGLGHLMTILGVWSSSLALPWLMFNVERLSRFKVWLGASWLFTFCFLSYTAALLFTGAVLVWVILVTARDDFPRARSVFTMLLAASTFAFLLYYIHWTLPFLMQSVPKIMGGAGLGGKAAEATPILARLALEPSKLSYSYGSMIVPLAGALSLLWLEKSWSRRILLTWMGILFFVSGVDLFFNFLLKHHYYVMLPVSVGLGALMARVESRWGTAPAIVLTVLIMSLGLKTAVEVALGLIP